MPTRYYIGAIRQIATIIDGTETIVEHGQPLEVSDAQAAKLDRSTDWSDTAPGAVLPDKAAEVVAWVGQIPARAAEALAVEQARNRPRATVLEYVKPLISGTGDSDDEGDDH